MPFLWMLSTAVKPTNQIFLNPPKWIPDPIKWENFATIFKRMPLFAYTKNTLVVAILAGQHKVYAVHRPADVPDHCASGMGSADGRRRDVHPAAHHHLLPCTKTVYKRHFHDFRLKIKAGELKSCARAFWRMGVFCETEQTEYRVPILRHPCFGALKNKQKTRKKTQNKPIGIIEKELSECVKKKSCVFSWRRSLQYPCWRCRSQPPMRKACRLPLTRRRLPLFHPPPGQSPPRMLRLPPGRRPLQALRLPPRRCLRMSHLLPVLRIQPAPQRRQIL